MPNPDAQAHSLDLIDHVDGLATAEVALGKRVEELRSAELRLAYAEVGQ